jgi:hypothetical protein
VKTPRRSLAALVTAVALTGGLSACNSGDSGTDTGSSAASPTPAIAADPKQALLDSTKELKNGNFRFTMTGAEMTGDGVVHMPTKSAKMAMKMNDPDMSMNMELIYVEPDSWVKITFGGVLADLPQMKKIASGKYLHVDQSKAKGLKDLQFDTTDVDPAGSDLLTKAIVDVQKTGEGAYRGTLDLSKATDAGMVDADVVKTLGAQAKAVPFEATLDPQGRLTMLSVKVPPAGDVTPHELKVTYADYGAATPPQKPAASETQEAPAEAYEMFK